MIANTKVAKAAPPAAPMNTELKGFSVMYSLPAATSFTRISTRFARSCCICDGRKASSSRALVAVPYGECSSSGSTASRTVCARSCGPVMPDSVLIAKSQIVQGEIEFRHRCVLDNVGAWPYLEKVRRAQSCVGLSLQGKENSKGHHVPIIRTPRNPIAPETGLFSWFWAK